MYTTIVTLRCKPNSPRVFLFEVQSLSTQVALAFHKKSSISRSHECYMAPFHSGPPSPLNMEPPRTSSSCENVTCRPIHICSGTQIWTGCPVFFIAQHVHAASSQMFYLGYSLRFWNDSWLMFRFCLLWSCSSSQRKKEDDPLQNITGQQHLKSNDQLPGWNQAWNVLGWLNHGCWQSLLDESRRCKHYPTQ